MKKKRIRIYRLHKRAIKISHSIIGLLSSHFFNCRKKKLNYCSVICPLYCSQYANPSDKEKVQKLADLFSLFTKNGYFLLLEKYLRRHNQLPPPSWICTLFAVWLMETIFFVKKMSPFFFTAYTPMDVSPLHFKFSIRWFLSLPDGFINNRLSV